MKSSRVVVIAVDVNQDPKKAFKELKQLNVLEGAEIHLVHMFEVVRYNFDLTGFTYPSEESPKLISSIVGMLKDMKGQIIPHPEKYNVKYKCLFDTDAKIGFCEYVEKVKADLVIIATRQRKGIKGFFESSFAQYVSKHTKAHTLVLKASK